MRTVPFRSATRPVTSAQLHPVLPGKSDLTAHAQNDVASRDHEEYRSVSKVDLVVPWTAAFESAWPP